MTDEELRALQAAATCATRGTLKFHEPALADALPDLDPDTPALDLWQAAVDRLAAEP